MSTTEGSNRMGMSKRHILMLIPVVALATVAMVLIVQSITAQAFENVEIHAQVYAQEIVDMLKKENPELLNSAVVLDDITLSKMPTVKKALEGAIEHKCDYVGAPLYGICTNNGYSIKASSSEVDLLLQLASKQNEGTGPYTLETTDYPSGQPATITSDGALVKYKDDYFLIVITRVR